MDKIEFSPEYYKAEEEIEKCTNMLEQQLDKKGNMILLRLIRAQAFVLGERVREHFYEGFDYGYEKAKKELGD